jgi:hypothetical protein
MADGAGGEGGQGEGTGGEGAEFMNSLASEFGSIRGEIAHTRKEAQAARGTIDRIKEAVGVENQAQEAYWYDEVLDQLLEAEKSGKSLPMTARLASVLAETQKASKQQAEMIARLEAQLRKQQNPDTHVNAQTYAALDTMIVGNLEKIFGEVDSHLYDSVSVKIADALKDLQKNHPKQWENIRRSSDSQKKLVSWAIQGFVPPSAKKLVMDQWESQQPITDNDFQNAFEEAKQIPDAKLRAKAIEAVRIQYWSHKQNQRSRRR